MGTKPILFNTENVRALLEGKKTNTRRVVKFKGGQNPAWSGYVPDGAVLYGSNNIPAAKAPYQPGDILWVRETWAHPSQAEIMAGTDPDMYLYKADEIHAAAWDKWLPSIHMPLEAARIFLLVTGVRAERLHEISQNGCIAEGIQWSMADTRPDQTYGQRPRELFAEVWNRTIEPKDLATYGWAANPWVWVIEFERISREEAKGK